MSLRWLLRRQLYNSWRKTIEEYYQNQLINSEGGLQVFFCASLLEEFKKEGRKRRIFIDSRIATEEGRRSRRPDIVICNSTKIIGIVELKYLPRVPARAAKDLETLRWIAEQPDRFSIQNHRYLGIARDKKRYPLAEGAVLCWAGVHCGKGRLDPKLLKGLNRHFLELHALTSPGDNPRIESSYRPGRIAP